GQYPRTFAVPCHAERNETWPGLRGWSPVLVERGSGLPHIPARNPAGPTKPESGWRRLLAWAKGRMRAGLPPTTRPAAASLRAPGERTRVSYSISLACGSAASSTNRDQLPPRSEEQGAIRHCRRRQAGLVQLIGSCERVLVSRRQHKDDALFAGEIDMPPVRYGRGGA